MGFSNHYVEERKIREQLIMEQLGEGEIIHRTVVYDNKRNKEFLYEISTTAILTVRAIDDTNLIITRYPMRPSRLNRYFPNCPQWLMELSIKYSRDGLKY